MKSALGLDEISPFLISSTFCPLYISSLLKLLSFFLSGQNGTNLEVSWKQFPAGMKNIHLMSEQVSMSSVAKANVNQAKF